MIEILGGHILQNKHKQGVYLIKSHLAKNQTSAPTNVFGFKCPLHILHVLRQ